jgi:hypothetical protein
MRDTLHDFGEIDLATKDTDVYSADSLDFNTPDAKSRFSKHQTGLVDDLCVVFRPQADFASIDGMIPFIEDDSDSEFGTAKKILIGEEVTAPEKGQAIVLPMPKQHRQHLRAGCTPKSSGTFTAKTVEASIELGTNLVD